MALYKSVYYYYYYYQLITETMRNILKVSVCLLCGEECEFGDREDWCSGVSPHNCYSDAVVCCHTCPALQLPHAQPGKASAAQVRRPMYGTTTLTTWHCPQSPAAAAAIDRYLLPAGPTAANS